MYLKFILNDFIYNLRKYGLTCWVLLSFLYLFLIGLHLVTTNGQLWIKEIGLSQSADVYFKDSTELDDIQMIIQQLEKGKLPLKIEIEELQGLVKNQTSKSDQLLIEDINIELLPKLTLSGHFKDYQYFKNFLMDLNNNPLIDEIISAEKNNNLLITLLESIQSLANVFILISLALSLVIGLIILKLITQKKENEIQILKSIGSSNLFIIWPQLLFIACTQILAFFSSYIIYMLLIKFIKSSAHLILWISPFVEQIQYLSLNATFSIWIISFVILVLISYFSSFYSIRKLSNVSHSALILFIFAYASTNGSISAASEGQLRRIENEMLLIKSQNTIIEKKTQSLDHQYKKSKLYLADMAKFMHKLNSHLKYNMQDNAQWRQINNQIKVQSYLAQTINKNLSKLNQQAQELNHLNKQLARRQLKLKKLETHLTTQTNSTLESFDINKSYLDILSTLGHVELTRLLSMQKAKELKATIPTDAQLVFNKFDPRIGHTLIFQFKPDLHLILSGLKTNFLTNSQPLISADSQIGEFMLKKKVVELRFKNQPVNLAWLATKGRTYEKP